MSNHFSQNKVKTSAKPAQVDEVVQEYMDSLLVDTFPDIPVGTDTSSNVVELAPKVDVATPDVKHEVKAEPQPQVETKVETKIESKVELKETVEPKVEESVAAKVEEKVEEKVETEQKTETPLAYPKAPPWAQQEFDVLLFEVCGLKLAVTMEALGRIIKSEHETNTLIGRPDWFLGAYHESEQHYYVVDTARYIMPEKGFDLSQQGYQYIIQMQHSKWTLACQKLHTTVRLHPDDVKWRTANGKRQWLAGTVVDHMCALIHVDSLIDDLDAQAS
ncbi:chemotaxis protein CheW [Bermanella sp. R86510]|uniref:chemotaxis protein CheW n=1 Tax=unclassified Bermanella TaxID=2627862 RepID=UPI0037C8801B